jgi:hypothetical protein
MRHKDVTQCSIGAFGFYLLFRFHKSGEMDDGKRPNFAENDEWFHIKILTDGTVTDTKKELLKRSYTDPIRKVFKKLGIYSFHFGHWGRVNAPAKLEFEELHPEFIRILGKSLRLFDCRFHFVHSLIFFHLHRQLGHEDPGSKVLSEDPNCSTSSYRRLRANRKVFAPTMSPGATREPPVADFSVHRRRDGECSCV